MDKQPLPYNTPLDDVLVKIQDTIKNPNVGRFVQTILKEGPRTFKVATLFEIMNPAEHKFHHYSLRIDTIDRTKKRGWFSRPDSSAHIEGDDDDEIKKLYLFLKAIVEKQFPSIDGDVHIIDSSQYNQLQRFLQELPKLPANDKLEIIMRLLSKLEGSSFDISQFISAFEKSDATALQHIGTAAKMVEYQRAFTVMKDMVETCCTFEQKIQEHLKTNPWMFGSEYSELLDRRKWVRDDQFDFMLRRTVDGYLEIIEIKTPFKEPLFIHDESYDSYHPSAKLSSVLGQVIRYISEMERNRDSIKATDQCDPLKIRARIIIGHDGDPNQQEALRKFNAHLHGIEILTFDQLIRIAGRVISVFKGESIDTTVQIRPAEDDLPF